MRELWSEARKRSLWRQMWLALAEAEAEFGLVTPEQLDDLRMHQNELDIERSLEVEAEIRHDLMAELRVYAAQCQKGGGILHLGATSMDIEDNAEALRVRASLDLVLERLHKLLEAFAVQIDRWVGTPVMAFTHLQPAEPTTLGFRLALYAQDLLEDYEELRRVREGIRGKGFTGAVGSSAAYTELIGTQNLARFQSILSQKLDLPFFSLSSQVYPRKQDYRAVSALAGLAASLYKFAFDLRFLQSPPVGELSEPFGSKQVGSSAMPFKRNPIRAENIDSLARLLAQFPRTAWDNAAHSLLERTLDDSGNRRSMLPEMFLAAEEIIRSATRIVEGLVVNETAMRRNLDIFGPFAASERVLMALVKAGADRQAMHEKLRSLAMKGWDAVQLGEPNPFVSLVSEDPEIRNFLMVEEILPLLDASKHTGDAEERARRMAERVREVIRDWR
jgi:adenylosuccinate lyase